MLIQKFHPGISLHKGAAVSTASGLPLFSRQGHWDGGSTVHCVARDVDRCQRMDACIFFFDAKYDLAVFVSARAASNFSDLILPERQLNEFYYVARQIET